MAQPLIDQLPNQTSELGRLPRPSGAMARSLSNALTMLLALCAGAVAILLTIEHFSAGHLLPCGPGGGCEGVLKSAYGQLGPIPTAAFGFLLDAVILGLAFRRRTALTQADQATVGRLDMPIFALAAVGAAVSWWLQYTAIFVIGAFCPWCATHAALVTVIALLAARDYLIAGRALTGEQKMLAGVLSFIALLMAFVYVPVVLTEINRIQHKSHPISETIRDLVSGPNLHIKGNAKAPYLLVEFADYQCPSCRAAVQAAETVLTQRGDLVKLAFRNYPLQMHKWGMMAARAAEAAGLQGKFWEMHDYIYQHQDDFKDPGFSPDRFSQWAREVGVRDIPTFEHETMNGLEVTQRITQDQQAAHAVGVEATPTFVFVGPTHPWVLGGGDEMIKAMSDTSGPMWQKPNKQ